MSFLRGVARVISGAGLIGVGALHAVWATGSPWPAKNRRRLAEATVGTATDMPATVPTAFVAAAALAAGAVSAGALGEGRFAIGIRRLVGCALLTRGLVGGSTALAVLGMPKPSRVFTELDNRYYRPLCLVLALAVFVAASRRRAQRVRARSGDRAVTFSVSAASHRAGIPPVLETGSELHA